MKPRPRYPSLVSTLTLCVLFANAAPSIAAAAAAAKEEPAPELTEVWTPKPAVISAPAGGIPSDAIVLFDGKSLDEWEPVRSGGTPWKIEGDAMVVVPVKEPNPSVDQQTKRKFGDIQLHLEFRTPAKVEGK